MSDAIVITGLKSHGFHGVLDFEKASGQDFIVDLELRVDLVSAATSDSLEKTVDYAVISNRVIALIEGEPFDLIETLAHEIAKSCLEFDMVESAKVTVHKPQAPIAATFTDVAVTIERGKI